MKSEFFNIVGDKNKIQNHIIFCGTFILVYEYFISSWKQGVFFLYRYCKIDIDTKSNVFHTDERFVKLKYGSFKDLRQKNEALKNEIGNAFRSLINDAIFFI